MQLTKYKLHIKTSSTDLKKSNKSAFSIIEVLVWIVIFLFWIASVYSIINSNLNLNIYNKSYIIWVNLAREQLELFRFIRDSNFKNTQTYNIINPEETWCEWETCNVFKDWEFYKISNYFWSDKTFSVEVKPGDKIDDSKELKDIDIASLANYQVCFDETNNLYDYCENISQNSQKKELRIYKYIKISKLTWDDKFIENLDTDKALKVTSVVIWYTKRYQKFEVEEIFTNYKIY